MTKKSYPRCFSDLYEAIDEYKNTIEEHERRNFLTALIKYVLPALGIKVPKSKRMTPEEQEKYLEKIKLIPFSVIGELLEKLEKYFDKTGITKESRYSYRSRIKKFINTYNAYAIPEHDPQDLSVYRVKPPYSSQKVIKTTNKTRPTKLVLETYPDSFNAEIEEFAQFLRRMPDLDSEATVTTNIEEIKRHMGWLVRTNQVKYEDISLNEIMPLVKLYLRRLPQKDLTEDALRNLSFKKMLAESECQDIGQNIVNRLEALFAERNILPATAINTCTSIINLGKFIYKDETNVVLVDDCNDIPIVLMLRKLRSKYDKKRAAYRKVHNQNTDGKMLPWETVQDVLERIRLYFEGGIYIKENKIRAIYINNKKIKKNKISNHTLAEDLQRFLLLAFFTIMPPDRQRTIRELTYGKTLRYGFVDDNYHFTSAEKLTSQKAQYYIYLGLGDYKTWKKHGRWFAPIPDKKFDIPNEGKSFHDYLKEWLFDGYIDENGEKQGYRNALNPKSPTVFVNEKGGQICDSSMSRKIKTVIFNYTGIPATPHTLRHIFTSRIYQGDLDEATLKAFHLWMKHSPNQAATYTHLSQNEKIAKAIEAIESVPNLF